MMKQVRKIVSIDPDKCDGCGLCIPACAEGAIQIIDGKARLVADNLCDGLGNCLGTCPRDAITVTERPAEPFDAAAAGPGGGELGGPRPGVFGDESQDRAKGDMPCGCPGAMMRKLGRSTEPPDPTPAGARPSRLGNWPVQLALLPVAGDIWRDADVLIVADCVGFAMPDFHERLLNGGEKALAVACPKLDDIETHTRKLASIFANNGIRSLTVAHMEVPCCGGLVTAVREAIRRSGRTDIPLRDLTVSMDGSVIRPREESD